MPHHGPADRLKLAGWLVGAAIGVMMLAAAITALDALQGLRQDRQDDIALYRACGLSEIALAPAGRPAHGPVSLPGSIDWRFLPSLPEGDPGSIRLLDNGRLAVPP
jgi:hypothetical protein